MLAARLWSPYPISRLNIKPRWDGWKASETFSYVREEQREILNVMIANFFRKNYQKTYSMVICLVLLFCKPSPNDEFWMVRLALVGTVDPNMITTVALLRTKGVVWGGAGTYHHPPPR